MIKMSISDDKEGEADEGDMDDPDKERRSEHKPSMESVDNIAGSSHSELFKAKSFAPQSCSNLVSAQEPNTEGYLLFLYLLLIDNYS